jgi:glycosyltransferase involved in cell wall biosynthesis
MDKVLVLTPIKDAAEFLPKYFERLGSLTYPRTALSVGLLESDSKDDSWSTANRLAENYRSQFVSIDVFKRDYGFSVPEHLPRWTPALQKVRRAILARARNQLLFRALKDHDWVLWLDVDVVEFPVDLIEHLVGFDLDILHPDCVTEGTDDSFDLNAWKDHGCQHMQDLRGTGGPVRIDSVGGTVLLIRANCHRDGLVFPAYPYGVESAKMRETHPVWGQGEIETEGLAMMASDMGLQCWGLPDYRVSHASHEAGKI